MTSPSVAVLALDEDLLIALGRLLTMEGCTVRTALGLEHARALAVGRSGPDEQLAAVLVDVRLLTVPSADLAALRAAFPGTRVVALAGRADSPALRRAVAEGALALTADFPLPLRQVLDRAHG